MTIQSTRHLLNAFMDSKLTQKLILGLGLAIVLLVTGVSNEALAKGSGFSGGGRFVISSERLFGFTIGEFEIDHPAPFNDTKIDYSFFSLGWAGDQRRPFAMPRIGLDYFVDDALSFGASIGFFSTEYDYNNSIKDNDTGFIFIPRVGYQIGISSMWSVWLRGGVNIYSRDDDESNNHDDNQVGLALEALFVVAPAGNFGFMVGPTIDISSGDYGDNNRDSDLSEWSIGITLGSLGWF